MRHHSNSKFDRILVELQKEGDNLLLIPSPGLTQEVRGPRSEEIVFTFFKVTPLEKELLESGSVLTFDISENQWNQLNRTL